MTIAGLEREIDALAALARAEPVERRRTYYRTDPPKGISRSLLVRPIAYEMQAKRYGGLKPAIDRRLRTIANGTADGGHGGRKTAASLQPDRRIGAGRTAAADLTAARLRRLAHLPASWEDQRRLLGIGR